MSDPFIIDDPCLWSFSGGRTSAYMLWRALQAHSGKLPDDHVVAFANTGKEREETLRFVHECAIRWNVRVVMVEWRPTIAQAERIRALADEQGAHPALADIAAWAVENADDRGYALIGLNSASRNGEPFAALIALKQRLPNWQERWCTSFLKIAAMHAYMRDAHALEPGDFREPVGLRHDEPKRIATMLNGDAKTGRRRTAPLDKARLVKADVTSFWAAQDFDLGLIPGDGNCDLCFAMGKGVRLGRLRRRAGCGKWWSGLEVMVNGTFDRRDSVDELIAEARRTPDLRSPPDPEEETECGDGGCEVDNATALFLETAA